MGACDPSCSERHPCGVLGCPSSPFIDPPAVIEPETVSLRPSGTTGALEETSPLITAANESHPLEQPPSAPVLPDKAISPTPQPPPLPPPPPPPPPMMAAPMPYQEQAIPPRQFVGESSAPPQPAAPPQGLDNHEVPIQRVESVDYPPPGHRPFGGEDLGRRGTRRPFPGPHSRWYDFIPLISDLGRYRCRQYYPNDYYLNNRPSYRRVENFWYGRDSDNCAPPRSRKVRDRVPSYCPNMDDYNYVPLPVPPPPLRRWNTFPTREPPSSSSARQNHEDPQAGPSDGRQPAAGDQGTLVRDNIVIGDPTRVRIGEGNRGGRSTGGRVTGNVVIR